MIPTLTSLKVGDKILYAAKESFDRRDALNLSVRWYEGTILVFDNNEPVLRTHAGHYHRRPMNEFYFRPYSNTLMTQPNTVNT